MSTSLSFMIHNEDLRGLKNLYIIMKTDIIKRSFKELTPEEISNLYTVNTTLAAVRSIIIEKLTNKMYYDYTELYEENNILIDSCTLDFTYLSEWKYIEHYQKELDLVDFFIANVYSHAVEATEDSIKVEEIFSEIEWKADLSEDIKQLQFTELLNNRKQN